MRGWTVDGVCRVYRVAAVSAAIPGTSVGVPRCRGQYQMEGCSRLLSPGIAGGTRLRDGIGAELCARTGGDSVPHLRQTGQRVGRAVRRINVRPGPVSSDIRPAQLDCRRRGSDRLASRHTPREQPRSPSGVGWRAAAGRTAPRTSEVPAVARACMVSRIRWLISGDKPAAMTSGDLCRHCPGGCC